MNWFKNIYFIILLLIFSVDIVAQQKDFQLWTSLEIEKKLSKHIRFNYAEEVRWSENVSFLNQHFSEIGLGYKLNKHISFSVNYRFSQKQNLDFNYEMRHRWFVDLSLKQSLRKWDFSFKSVYQSQYSQYFSSEDGKIPANYSRNKLLIKYEINRRWKPFLSSEIFIPLNSPDFYGPDEARIAIGTDYNFGKRLSLTTFYGIQQEFNVKNPESNFVLGLGLKYDW